MKNYLPAISLSLAAALAASPAMAAPFEGPYVGAQAGWNENKVGTADTDIGTVSIDRTRDTVAAGIFAGYNLKAGDRIVLSAERAVNFGFDDGVSRVGRDTVSRINYPDSAREAASGSGTCEPAVYAGAGFVPGLEPEAPEALLLALEDFLVDQG